MKFDAFLTFWMAHNEAIIQWILASIVGSGTWLMFRAIFRGERVAAATAEISGAAIDELKSSNK